MSHSIFSLLQYGTQYLKKKGVETARLDAELILSHLLSKERVYLYAHPEQLIDADTKESFIALIKERAARFPLAYVIGRKEFFGRDFSVEKGVFCPRPETELLIEEYLKTFGNRRNLKTCEIGTGTGAISITIALEHPFSTLFACDISKKAINLTKKNINRYALSDRVFICYSNLLASFKKGLFHCIVSNPPYLSKEDYLQAEPEVRKEPVKALMSKNRGLFAIKKIIRTSKEYLSDGGYLFIEIGDGQGEEVANYANKNGFVSEIIFDLAGKERILKAKLK